MAYQTGDVVLVNYPYTDLTTVKARPAVVLSSDAYHSEQPDIILGALTSNLAAAVDSLDYVLQDWSVAALRFPTAFKPVLATLDPRLIVHHIGQLSSHDLGEIHARVRKALGL
jgi:mRNA interferase MazF